MLKCGSGAPRICFALRFQFAQPPEMRPRLFRVRRPRRHGHQPVDFDSRQRIQSPSVPPAIVPAGSRTCSPRPRDSPRATPASSSRPRSARLLISCARAKLSTLWIISKSSTASRHLFDCRWPMKCQRNLPGHSGIFAFASCTLFSPNTSRPRPAAALMVSGGCAFGTASSVTEFGHARPARSHAAEIRC